MKHIVIPIFIPHKGCPFDCIYCNQKIISGQTDEITANGMRKIIEMHLSSIGGESSAEIAFYGGSFTGIDREQQISFLKIANEYFSDCRIKSIRLSTRPDYINNEILEYLKKYNVKTIELGAQSLDETVLAGSCRGHGAEDVEKAANLIKEYGIELGIQTMIGLPGDTMLKDIETAHKVVKMKPQIVRIYPALVIRNTYMETMYLQGRYSPLSLEDAVEICAKLLDIYESNDINVIRVGLQPTDTINENMDVVSGPFHPAFRQIVESRRMRVKIQDELEINRSNMGNKIIIYVSSKNISNVIGQKRENIEFLKRKFNVEFIKVAMDRELCGNEIKLEFA